MTRNASNPRYDQSDPTPKFDLEEGLGFVATNHYVADCAISVRLAFLRKVYTVLALQLCCTIVVGTVFMTSSSLQSFVRTHAWPSVVVVLLQFGLLFALFWKKNVAPYNALLLGCWTLSTSCLVGVAVTGVATAIVLQAMALTLSVFVALTVYTFQSKRDFTGWGSALFAGLWILIFGGMLQIFFPFSHGMHFVFSVLGALLFCGFIIFDTQRIIRHTAVDDWVPACVELYLDVINLFLYILDLLNHSQR
eukprot:NODE_3698_length_917_cov_45.068354_g3546_i0.p1 GENE.NODE_3698_length_917_cov_45.068354_g3546_i0~~NODE_3698_length_917_cov_45.068354_g3546_i0.p1  ORF type:complete len:250 (-),score=55.70 NODE_3698_length_917_cov_45.068354_g3546_i0:122-871(-)